MNFKDKTREFVLNHSNEDSFVNLEKYVALIEEKNKVMNLTGFTGDRLWQEGIYESIVSLFEIFGNPESKTMLDIGAGAGFPSVPFKIVFPKIKLTIIEPQLKRIAFLKEVAQQLEIEIELIVSRAEDVKNRTFSLITARAVAPLFALAEISSHLGKIGAHYGFLKGPSIFTEIKEAKSIIDVLKVKAQAKRIENDLFGREAYYYEYTKDQETPIGYPRPWAKIVSKK